MAVGAGGVANRCHTTGNIALTDDGHGTADIVCTAVGEDGQWSISLVPSVERAALNNLLQLMRNGFVGILLAREPRASNYGIAVADHHREGAGFVQRLCILSGKGCKLANGGVLFKNDLALAIGVNFERVALANTHGSSNFLGDNNTPEVINSSNNSGSFHIYYLASRGEACLSCDRFVNL